MSYLGLPIPFTETHKIFYLLRRLIDGKDLTREETALAGAWLPPNPYIEVHVTKKGLFRRLNVELDYTEKGYEAYQSAIRAVLSAYNEISQMWSDAPQELSTNEKALRIQRTLPDVFMKYGISTKAELIAYRVVLRPGYMSFMCDNFFKILRVKHFGSEDEWSMGMTREECLESLHESPSELRKRYDRITIEGEPK